MLNQLYNRQTRRFLIAGGIAAFVNILVIFVLVEKFEFNTFLLRNLANFIAVEISLIVSFFLYRTLVWRGGKWLFKRFIFQQLPLYRVASNLAVLTRVLLIFPLLDKLGVPYNINTFIGILCSVTINYLFRDRFIFNNTFGKNLYPEALAPALMGASLSQEKNTPSLNASIVPISLFSLVIPAYNEEGCIASTIAAIAQQLDSHQIEYEILVVNDNSKDRTEAILQEIIAQNPKVRYINNYYPNGFGFAVRCGLENFSGDAIAGPGQMGKVDRGVFTLWMAAHYFQKALSYIGYGVTGKQVRDVLYIDNLVDLVDYQIHHFSGLDGDILNVGGGAKNSLSLRETTQLCAEITGKTIAIEPIISERKGDVPWYVTDTTKIQATTHWQPQHSPQSVLMDIYDWLVRNEQFLKPILG